MQQDRARIHDVVGATEAPAGDLQHARVVSLSAQALDEPPRPIGSLHPQAARLEEACVVAWAASELEHVRADGEHRRHALHEAKLGRVRLLGGVREVLGEGALVCG